MICTELIDKRALIRMGALRIRDKIGFKVNPVCGRINTRNFPDGRAGAICFVKTNLSRELFFIISPANRINPCFDSKLIRWGKLMEKFLLSENFLIGKVFFINTIEFLSQPVPAI